MSLSYLAKKAVHHKLIDMANLTFFPWLPSNGGWKLHKKLIKTLLTIFHVAVCNLSTRLSGNKGLQYPEAPRYTRTHQFKLVTTTVCSRVVQLKSVNLLVFSYPSATGPSSGGCKRKETSNFALKTGPGSAQDHDNSQGGWSLLYKHVIIGQS